MTSTPPCAPSCPPSAPPCSPACRRWPPSTAPSTWARASPTSRCDPTLPDMVTEAMRAGHNQYPMMTGVPALREAIAAKVQALYGARYDAGAEITVTAGATQAVHDRDPVLRASGRRSDRHRTGLRLLPAGHRAGRRRGGAGVDAARRRRLQRAVGHGGRRGHAAHPPDHHQLAAQPDRLGPARSRHATRWPTSCAAPTS